MARPKKIKTDESVEKTEEKKIAAAIKKLDNVIKSGFDPSLPESKQRHLR